MAVKKPICLYDGVKKELQAGDSLPGNAAGMNDWAVVEDSYQLSAGDRIINLYDNYMNASDTPILWLPFDGANDATSATDASSYNHTVTFSANAKLSTAYKKFGTASLNCGSSVNYVSMADHACWDTGTTPFCLQAFVRLNSVAYAMILDRLTATRQGVYLHEGSIYAFGKTFSPYTPTLYVQNHIAITYDGTNLRAFANGTQVGSAQALASVAAAATAVYSGCAYNQSVGLRGYIDELVYTTGRAIWTSNFTVPTKPYCIARTFTLPESPVSGNTVVIKTIATNDNTPPVTTVALNGSKLEGQTSDIAITNNSCCLTLMYTNADWGWGIIDYYVGE